MRPFVNFWFVFWFARWPGAFKWMVKGVLKGGGGEVESRIIFWDIHEIYSLDNLNNRKRKKLELYLGRTKL